MSDGDGDGECARKIAAVHYELQKKKREAIICYAGLTLKQGISGKL